MADEATIAFVKRQADGARFVTSVCIGALVLGAAGLLRGKRATTHWASHDLFESRSRSMRVVRGGKLMNGGGVTAGIDFALTLIAELAPRFNAGSPETAPAAAVQTVRKRMTPILEERRRLAQAAARGLRLDD
jgi:cyclohexyl-isocyanide hydratase